MNAANDTVVYNDVTASNNTTHHYYYYSEDYDYEQYNDHIFQIFDFEIPIYGYIWPILVLFTSLCNILVIAGFLRRRMRNPTNALLVSIAISDSLTGLVTLPATFHIYAGRNMFLTEDWCNVSMITRLYIARAFHTVSVWQTLVLGIHRYLQVRHPALAQRHCTMKRTLVSVGVIYVLAFVLHMYHAFDIKAVNGFCHWEVEEPCGWTCVYIWCTLLSMHVLPCAILTVLAILMIKTVRVINSNNMAESARRKSKKSRNVTIVVILVVVIFLIPELPYGIFYLSIVSLRHSKKALLPLETNRIFHCIYEILLVVSFHLNFWVYCILVRKFRSCIKALLRLVICDHVSFQRLEAETTTSSSKGVELEKIETEMESE